MKTELVFILDRSGSMGGLETDTIGGFNSMLAKQQKEKGECRVTTALFDDRYEILHDRLDIQAVRPMDEKQYFVRGATALLDAIGKTLNKIINAQKRSKPECRADKVLFIITTDGLENASREFSSSQIKKMIERQKTKYQWEFIFLGANIDAVETAESIGIDKDRAQNFINDSEGIALNYEAVSHAVSCCRASFGAPIPSNWNKRIEEDLLRRKESNHKER